MYVVTPPPFAILPSSAISVGALAALVAPVNTSVPTWARTPEKRGARPWPFDFAISLRGVRDISSDFSTPFSINDTRWAGTPSSSTR